MPEIIFDTNVLSNFVLAGELDLLRKLYPVECCCTGFVLSEVQRGLRRGHSGLAQLSESILKGWPRQEDFQSQTEKQLFGLLSISLGDGESSSIALAANRGFTLACDDRLARREATRLGVLLTGSIGILLKALRVEVFDLHSANQILKKMIKNGFYSPVARITQESVDG